jgi:hypothetical protein
MALTRGLRNNNPGNIDFHSSNKWVGQVGIEQNVPKPRFARFDKMENGVRAMCKLLQSYKKKYAADTVREVVSRYAPVHENKTDKYIENVCKWSGLMADEPFDAFDRADLRKIIPAIIRQENGVTIQASQVEAGIVLAT